MPSLDSYILEEQYFGQNFWPYYYWPRLPSITIDNTGDHTLIQTLDAHTLIRTFDKNTLIHTVDVHTLIKTN